MQSLWGKLQNTRPTYSHKSNLYCILTRSSETDAKGKQRGPGILQLFLAPSGSSIEVTRKMIIMQKRERTYKVP